MFKIRRSHPVVPFATAARVNRRAMLGSSLVALAMATTRPLRAATPQVRQVSETLAIPGGRFIVGWDKGRITSLRDASGRLSGDVLKAGARLGNLCGVWRAQGGAWSRFDTAGMSGAIEALPGQGAEIQYPLAKGVSLSCRLLLDGECLKVLVRIENATAAPVEFGDVALPLPINRIDDTNKDPDALLKHSFIAGQSSHVFWRHKDVSKPWLAMLPEKGSSLEYWDAPKDSSDLYRVYFHAAAQVAAVRKAGSRWRLPASSLIVPAGESREMGVRFLLVDGQDAMRRAIADHGLLDVEVVPGMTVPVGSEVRLSFGSRVPVEALIAEHGAETRIAAAGQRANRQVYVLRFERLGENHITVRQADGGITTLEFFVTQAVETMIAKRGAFIAAHRHSDPAAWYNGLLAEWNMETQTLLGPDNYDRITGWRIYEVTCDDPGLSKPAFLAAKNAEFPVQAEIDALDDYVEHFVWGGLQRSTAESQAYGIYGIPDWHRNRTSSDPGPRGQMHIWRVYDYPHIAVMYFSLYRIARDHPDVRTRLSAATYLERAFGTARAMFVIPRQVADWDANSIGYYNELVIPDVIDALRREGRKDEAQELAALWEAKVHHFVNEVSDLYVSEYAFDSTGFESTQAIARYAMDRPERFAPDKVRAFNRAQMEANLFCRGWLQPSYYYLGSDYRASAGDAYTLSYMAQMGGWAILDHALHDVDDPRPLLRLGHAAALSSWALLNSGTPDSGYGYWYPGAANDGGAGGGFEPAALGETWLNQPHRHGSWYYACEIDLGFCGALRAARTTLVDDDLFGRIAMGGEWREEQGRLLVSPRDGVRRRFHARLGTAGLDLEVQGGCRFAANASIALKPDLSAWEAVIEHAQGPARSVRMIVSSPAGKDAGIRLHTASGEAREVAPGHFEIRIARGSRSTRIFGVKG
ncbi:DUF5695 domain-containing protein [Novosphingobium sp. KA1]|uniref:DUF5695 domain-containing protein n=1 Tax=Novosphingobium sp. (strain KA1) TaxID=164608 RepID=UPI001A8CEE93|nr:DUF5695 domain-containing protein [Novosphingobium sp. KA1]